MDDKEMEGHRSWKKNVSSFRDRIYHVIREFCDRDVKEFN